MEITLDEFKSNIDCYINVLFSSSNTLSILTDNGELSLCVSKISNNEEKLSLSEADASFLYEIKSYLDSKGLRYVVVDDAVIARQSGKSFTLSKHIKGLIYSLLSNQTKWNRIEPHLHEINEAFFDYDVELIKNKPGDYFENALFQLKCGNRKTSAQMNSLHENIATFERLASEYGSMDAFVTSAPAYEIVKLLSGIGSENKLHQVGEALAWEYLRNVGIDGAKPDLHMRRFLGSERIGASPNVTASPQEVILTVEALSASSGLSLAAIDNLIWSFCADGYGEICTSNPKCSECVIKKYCNRGIKGIMEVNQK